MNDSYVNENPFKVITPENMAATEVNALFVDPFTDFVKIREPGNTIVNGPRGCGKSMIFRYMLPDCQILERRVPPEQLPFLAFLISIKNTSPNLTELRRLHDRHAELVLNEHVLTIFSASKVFHTLANMDLPPGDRGYRQTCEYLEEIFNRRLQDCGGDPVVVDPAWETPCNIFRAIADICNGLYNDVVQYTRRLAFASKGPLPYGSALCGYLDFLFPILTGLSDLHFLPTGPKYLLIDDADYLNVAQTVVLNSWVSTRTQPTVSIKISTQLKYKSLMTSSGLPIQSPHDYQAINIGDVYTTRRGRYLDRVTEITRLRLGKAGINSTPAEFFPVDDRQEAKIRVIEETIRAEWQERGRGYRPGDDVLRYARPQYIRSLGGISKSRSTYSYAGFDHLVHISSGLVRYFLEAAAVMYDEQRSQNPGIEVSAINPSIQNQVVRAEANNLMFSDFESFRREEGEDDMPEQPDGAVAHSRMDKLYNLIRALGGIFFVKLISDDAERRVFSVAVSGAPDQDVIDTFELGVRYGYFHRSSIGNKDGTGRSRLYVLTRRLAPHFLLDPTRFSGYLWITADLLREAMATPGRVVRRLKKASDNQMLNTEQLTIFE